ALGKAAAAIDGASEETITTASFKPELATLRDRLPIGPEWLYEVKWDGYRILAAVADGRAALWSRNGISWNEKIPEIGRALEQLGITAARLDGELIALVDGKNDFNALQKTLAGEAEAPLAYMMFDLLHLEGRDLERVPLVRRKELLAKLLSRAQLPLAYSTHVEGDGEAAWEMATREKLEGVVCKRAASPYRAGRGDDWIKVKLRASDEFAVVGYTPPKGSRIGFGSLLLASPSATGWRYRGRVGSGFSQSQLRELERTVAMNGGKEPPIAITGVDPLLRRALWVKPRAVVEVMAHGIGANGLLRQPSLKAVRADKSPDDLRDGDRAPARKAGSEARRGRKPAEREAAADDDVKITHPDRVVFPEGNFTKENVADYYETVMESFLPGVIGRPTSVIRCPSGIGKPCFFQKHLMAGLKQGEGARLKEENGGEAVYICPESAASVIELVQFGAIEFHPWGSTSADPDHATRMIFDLDPGPGVAWKRVVAAARLVRELLTQVALEPFLRTTGGKGLHVLVPLNPPSPWPAVKQFARAFAESLAKMHPSELVAQAARSERADRIYIDYLRNDRGATSVASYSLRARPGAPVAAPVGWSELGKLKGGNAYDIRSTPKRLARRHEDPWAGIDALRQVLPELKSRGE
ncbi:MAG: DNA ligase D, partial [Acetobacteraceae bacterium]